MNPDKNKRQADDLTERLRRSLRARRFNGVPLSIGSLLFVLLFFGLLTWWLWPRPPLPRLVIVAFDAITSGDLVSVDAALAPIKESTEGRALDGQELIFLTAPQAGTGAQQILARTMSNPAGEAKVNWKFAESFNQADFLVRHLGDKYQPGSEDRGQVFRWPSQSNLLFVQIDSVLTSGDAEVFRTTNLHQIAPIPGFGTSFNQLAPIFEIEPGMEGVRMAPQRIVYLPPRGVTPLLYQKYRGWIRLHIQQSKLLPGAVIHWQDTETITRLMQPFQGQHRALIHDEELSKLLRALKVEVNSH